MDRPQQPYLPPYEQSQAMHNATTYGFVAPEGGHPPGPGAAPGAAYPQGPGAPGAGYPHGPAPTHGFSTGPPSNPNYPLPGKEGHYPGMGDAGGHQPTASAPSYPGNTPPQYQQPHFQQPQFQQQQFVGTTTLVTVPVMVGPNQRLGPQSCSVPCPKCGEVVRTTANSTPNMLAWMSCSVIAILGCFWGCCLIPFCLEPCQDVHHTCPRCNTYLGKYSRLS